MHATSSSVPEHLYGREAEVEALERLLADVRAGRGGSCVVYGEPGVGKTALLEHILVGPAGRVPGARTLRADGVEFEMELAYAALHQLCMPLLDGLGRLPEPQRTALEVAFGRSQGRAPERLGVALAVLGLLSEAAGDGPLVCVVDDAQWLDRASAQALAFVARRIEDEPIAMVFASREHGGEPGGSPVLDGLPELHLTGLADEPSRALLASRVHVPLDDRVRERILAEADGNPLALLELPRGMGPAQLAGGFGLPTPAPLSSRIERSFREREAQLPAHTRLLLLLAAAEPLGDAGRLWRAADLLAVDPAAGAPAEAAGLIELGGRARFRHPLVRSAVYLAASPADRRRAHQALAEATDPAADPDHRAWHRAQAAARPDDEVAAELVRSADRAQARGGAAAGAAFLERAAALTADPALRAGRLLAAAGASLEAGALDAALRMIADAEAGPLDDRLGARADLLRGRAEYFLSGGDEAVRFLVRAAERIAPFEPRTAREYLLDALQAALVSGRAGKGMALAVAAARTAPPPPGPPTTTDELLDALLGCLDGDPGSVPVLRRLLADADDAMWTKRLTLAAMLAVVVWDTSLSKRILTRQVEQARTEGSLTTLTVSLALLSAAAIHDGDMAAAVSMMSEEETLAGLTGAAPHRNTRLHLAALRDAKRDATALIEQTRKAAHTLEKNLLIVFADWASAVLHNGLGDYPTALAAAERAGADGDLPVAGFALLELVEAAVRCGDRERATAAFRTLDTQTTAAGTDFALGVRSYTAALLEEDGATAESHYRAAVGHLTDSGVGTFLARAHLVYGEWLRREGRRREARRELRLAFEKLSAMGAGAFADRARAELRATGERARRVIPDSAALTDHLTAHELTIARLAATGTTSREIAARLFLSPRTIDAHLRNIFKKLGITSRRQLAAVLPP
ncbi:helix-turn-helix domain-containing protein [Streptomyces sp. HC44]|uniref:Helix-turn-helix domain-containing protein n=1 Tax=Streptomyces scabichelini TaxID=2711217 RepID=A0A6G4UWK2_9ACTN|nr:LuxR family transcriptional regulator [Streptomyces scabichelini]NGO06131.1 helix-turn-helix domain-containing protein [Streptomyces scabichelini]